MSFRIPKWLSTSVWSVSIVLSAYFIGQSGALVLQDNTSTPATITITDQKQDEKRKIKTLAELEPEILPLLGEARANETAFQDESLSSPDNTGAQSNKWDDLIRNNSGQLIVKGTVVGPDTSIAFLNVNGEEESVYTGQVKGSFRVERITADSVIFDNDGETFTVSMFQPPGIPRKQARNINPPANQTNDNLDDIVETKGNRRIVDRRKFNALLEAPSSLADDLKFLPFAKDGSPYGLKISYLKPGSFFTKIGIQSGDVLTGMNNTNVRTVEDFFGVYQAFRNEDHITLEIDRNGAAVSIPVEFR